MSLETSNQHAQSRMMSARLDILRQELLAPILSVEGYTELLRELLKDPDFLEDLGVDEPGLNRLIHAAYSLLRLQTFFTAGEKEVRAWTIRLGTKAPQAAGVIHTDFEKGFIRAEVIKYDDYIELGSEKAVKAAGKFRLEGKEYIVGDGDVILFRFNV